VLEIQLVNYADLWLDFMLRKNFSSIFIELLIKYINIFRQDSESCSVFMTAKADEIIFKMSKAFKDVEIMNTSPGAASYAF